MKNTLALIILLGLFSCEGNQQDKSPVTAITTDTIPAEPEQSEPWNQTQLLQPGELAVKSDWSDIHIYNIGTAGSIKNAIKIGPGNDLASMETFRQELAPLSKDAEIVIYCGCCPFKDCPNIRPAFEVLNELQFTNHKLLDLPNNLKADWIDKGFPMND